MSRLHTVLCEIRMCGSLYAWLINHIHDRCGAELFGDESTSYLYSGPRTALSGRIREALAGNLALVDVARSCQL